MKCRQLPLQRWDRDAGAENKSGHFVQWRQKETQKEHGGKHRPEEAGSVNGARKEEGTGAVA